MRSETKSTKASGDGGEKKKSLFKKSMDELREAFVRARFAQEDVFGRADIEEWLKSQREAERPEYDHTADESYWNTLFSGDYIMWAAQKNPLVVLQERATSYQTLDHLRNPQIPSNEFPLPFEDDVLIQFIPLFTKFMTETRVCYGHTHGAIIVAPDMVSNPHPYTLRVEVRGRRQCELVIEPFNANPLRASLYVMDVLFAEWLYGRPKRERAREYLCDALADEIAKERVKAENDFNRAVAVSDDGLKIVRADKVVVIDDENNRAIVFPSKAFAVNKILRSPRMRRYTSSETAMRWSRKMPFAEWVRLVGKNNFTAICGDGQIFNNDDTRQRWDGKTRLMTAKRFCPDPLPEGGVELKV